MAITRLTMFEVVVAGDQTYTRALYANGRHQCKIEIMIVAEKQKPDGYFETVKLTLAQRSSISIARDSGDVKEVLPPPLEFGYSEKSV